MGDDVRHRERLAGARDAHQALGALVLADAADELVDRLRLIAGRLERAVKLETHAESYPRTGEPGRVVSKLFAEINNIQISLIESVILSATVRKATVANMRM